MRIEFATAEHVDEWVKMRADLWPDAPLSEHRQAIVESLARPHHKRLGLIVVSDQETIAAFAEASVRNDPVNGCDTSPVAFLEGIFVKPPHRQCGIARSLVDAVEVWGRSLGCMELESDTDWENVEGQAFHTAAGFVEMERVIFYKKNL